MTSDKKYTCFEIFAHHGDGFQEYIYDDGSIVPLEESVGVEITQNGKSDLFLYDGIVYLEDYIKK
tara:strand:- start:27671 stop:27865 length:195 start_codon:yes stop_codon:yes gene_type:complete